jgi:hypothetical protein
MSATIEEITEIANTRAPKYGLTPEAVIREASYYATRAEPSAASAVQWAIDTLLATKKDVGFQR